MFNIDLKSRKSIYEQVIDNMKELIVRGVLPPDTKVPSVRELSKMLVINPNTTANAYKELKAEGYLYTRTGLGSFVAPGERIGRDEEKIDKSMLKIRSGIEELRYLGLSEEEIRMKIEELLTKGGGRDDKAE